MEQDELHRETLVLKTPLDLAPNSPSLLVHLHCSNCPQDNSARSALADAVPTEGGYVLDPLVMLACANLPQILAVSVSRAKREMWTTGPYHAVNPKIDYKVEALDEDVLVKVGESG